VLESELPRLIRAQRRLAERVDTVIVPALGSGLEHEAGTAPDRAAALAACLDAGAIAVLANGPLPGGRSAGDAMLAQVLPCLPSRLEGAVVGAMSHAHVLTALAHRHPTLRTFMAPAVLEVLGALEDDAVAARVVLDTVALLEVGPPSGRLPAPPGALVPTVLRPGRAVGRVIAGNLTAAAWWAGSPAWPSGGILFLEACELRLIHVDRLLQRLRLLGVLASLDALLIGVPIGLVESVRALSLPDIVARATDGTSYPIALDAFAGSAWPSPRLRIGGTAEVVVDSGGIGIAWEG
jgi:hypothetical protein